ncbi:hypothetical protein AKO1_015525, partial [Acrasis kona]
MSDEDCQSTVSILSSILIHHAESPHWPDLIQHLKDVTSSHALQANQITSKRKLKNMKIESEDYRDGIIIKMINLISPFDQHLTWIDVYKQRAGVQDIFPEHIIASIPKSHHDVDVTKLYNQKGIYTFTIDSFGTRDMDDGITILSFDESKIRLGVHITNVSSLFLENITSSQDLLNHDLFKQAVERVTSIYIPGAESSLENTSSPNMKVIPMMPVEISEQLYSLVEGQVRPCVTYEFTIHKDGTFEFHGISLTHAVMEHNLSYDHVDSILNQKEFDHPSAGKLVDFNFWKVLSDCCKALEIKRLENGAIEFDNQSDLKVYKDCNDVISLSVSERRLFSSSTIITELAILVNSVSGEFITKNKVPCMYKYQPPYELKEPWAHSDPLHRKFLKITDVRFANGSAGVSADPQGNSVVGVPYYVQQTSPLRRLFDLLVQIQLVHYLKVKECLFTFNEMDHYAKLITSEGQRKMNVEQNTMDHLLVVYLNQCLQKGVHNHHVVFKGYDDDHHTCKLRLVDLNQYHITGTVNGGLKGDKVKILKKLKNIQVKIVEADPFSHSIMVEFP